MIIQRNHASRLARMRALVWIFAVCLVSCLFAACVTPRRFFLDPEKLRGKSFAEVEADAQAGIYSAQRQLAHMYGSGIGTERDPVLAFVWLDLVWIQNSQSLRESGWLGRIASWGPMGAHRRAIKHERKHAWRALSAAQRPEAKRLSADYVVKYVHRDNRDSCSAPPS
jgi:TPR repeat protein